MNIQTKKLPKILFIGAVTFEESSGSSPLFYRLFKNYPPDKLVVIGGEKYENPAFPKVRIPDVTYHILGDELSYPNYLFYGRKYKIIRKVNNLFNEFFAKRRLNNYYQKALKITKRFQPDLILSLTMSFQWKIAHRIAKTCNTPLNLVLHDQLETHLDTRFYKDFDAKFAEVFKFANNAFCISPTMEKVYRKRFGIASEICYPIGKNYSENTIITPSGIKEKNVVFFGSIWKRMPTVDTLITLAHLLDKKGWKLTVFSNQNIEFFIKNGLQTSNLQANSFMKNKALMDWCRKNATILCLPMSFAEWNQDAIKHSFPSKITDYTALGLPLLIHAPETSSIAEFVTTNQQYKFAELVITESITDLEKAIDKLIDENYRQMLGENSKKIWQRYFNPQVVRKAFFETLIK